MTTQLRPLKILLLCVIVVTPLQAQEDISGVYHVKGSSPEGGTNYVLFPDSTFVVGYFGGMITGTWTKQADRIVFKNRVAPKFVVYGRTIPKQEDTVQVRFNVRKSQGVAVGFNKKERVQMHHVFNKNPNCFSYPYIHKQTEQLTDFYVTNLSYDPDAEVTVKNAFHFKNPAHYNEFILINLPEEYTAALNFSARVENGLMYFGNSTEGIKKRPLTTLSEEDAYYLKNYTQNSILPAILNYGNEFFPYSEAPTEQELMPFTRIEVILLSSLKVLVLKDSIFIANCED